MKETVGSLVYEGVDFRLRRVFSKMQGMLEVLRKVGYGTNPRQRKSPCISTGASSFGGARRSSRQAKYCNLLCSAIQGEYEI